MRARAGLTWLEVFAALAAIGLITVVLLPIIAKHHSAANWESLSNTNISYFVSLDASLSTPNKILAGDRFLSTNDQPFSGILVVANWQALCWVEGGHHRTGNTVMSDGSVAQFSTEGF